LRQRTVIYTDNEWCNRIAQLFAECYLTLKGTISDFVIVPAMQQLWSSKNQPKAGLSEQ
jgi:hypothetical protein